MIKRAASGHPEAMDASGLSLAEAPPSGRAAGGAMLAAPSPARAASAEARLRGLVADYFDFIWRSLRRLGVSPGEVDDCAQQVFLVASKKLGDIQPGSERSYLFSTAMRVASDARRSRSRRREVHEDDAGEAFDPAPDPEQIADQKRARAVLDEVLDALPMDLRAPFVLFELEEMPTADIAATLDLPAGTVASRLRRAREEFQKIVARMQARATFRGGQR